MSQPLSLSPWTGRPLPTNSLLAQERLALRAATQPETLNPKLETAVPAGLARIIKPAAQTRWILPQLSAITPQYIESVMRGAFVGGQLQQWELFDLMEDTWPRLAKNLNEIKRAVLAMDWKIEPWAEEDMPPSDSAKERAKVCSNALWRMRPDPTSDENAMEQTIYDVLDAWSKGLSVIEIDWEIRDAGQLGNITAPSCTTWVHPVHYAWSNEGRLGLRSASLRGESSRMALPSTSYQPGRLELEDFPPDKFLIAISKAKTGSPLTTALLRPLCWWWCAANFSADWLMNLAQIFGLPIRWATYANGAAQSTIDAISSMLENLGSAGWASFPEGTTLDLKEAGNLGSLSPQGDLLDRADKQCDLLVLGQTLTSDTGGSGQGGGSLALGRVHEGVKGEVIQSAANFAARVLNTQLLPAICRLNYGDEEECPEICPEPEKNEDMKANADRDAVLLATGMEMPKEWFYKRHDIPLPQPGEEVITKPEPPPQPGFGRSAAVPGRSNMEDSNASENSNDAAPEDEATPKKKEDAYNAKSTIPPRLETTGAQLLARAIAADLQPVGRRLAAILQIQDPDQFKAKLAAFQQDLGKLQADLARDPETARALEQIISASLVNGMAANAKPK